MFYACVLHCEQWKKFTLQTFGTPTHRSTQQEKDTLSFKGSSPPVSCDKCSQISLLYFCILQGRPGNEACCIYVCAMNTLHKTCAHLSIVSVSDPPGHWDEGLVLWVTFLVTIKINHRHVLDLWLRPQCTAWSMNSLGKTSSGTNCLHLLHQYIIIYFRPGKITY